MNIEQIRTIFNVAEVLVEQAITTAETLHASKTEAERQQFVKDTVEAGVKSLEEHFNLLPGGVEVIAFKGLDFALGLIIPRVFAALEAKGVLAPLPA